MAQDLKYGFLKKAVLEIGSDPLKELIPLIEQMEEEVGSNNTLTKADIMAVKDNEKRAKLIQENIHLFE